MPPAADAAPLPLAHWHLRRTLKQALRRLQTAAGCTSSITCGVEGLGSLCPRCRHETALRLYTLAELAAIGPDLLMLLLALDGWERAEQSLYGGRA